MDETNQEKVYCTLLRLSHIIGKNSYVDEENGVLYCNDDDIFDECVFMTSHMFKEIWGRTWSSMSQEERILPVVKITYKGESIYRRYRRSSAQGFKKNQLALNHRSIGLLCSIEDIVNNESIEVSVGDEDSFFKNHPNHLTRITYLQHDKEKALIENANELSRKANEMNDEATTISKDSRKISRWSLIVSVVSIFIAILSLFHNC